MQSDLFTTLCMFSTFLAWFSIFWTFCFFGICVLFTKIYSGVDHSWPPYGAFAISPCDIMQLCYVEYFEGQQIERRSKPGSNNKKYNVGTKCTRQISFWQIYLPALSLYLKKSTFLERNKKRSYLEILFSWRSAREDWLPKIWNGARCDQWQESTKLTDATWKYLKNTKFWNISMKCWYMKCLIFLVSFLGNLNMLDMWLIIFPPIVNNLPQ